MGLWAKLLFALVLSAGLPTAAGFLGLVVLRSLAIRQSDVISQTIAVIGDMRGSRSFGMFVSDKFGCKSDSVAWSR